MTSSPVIPSIAGHTMGYLMGNYWQIHQLYKTLLSFADFSEVNFQHGKNLNRKFYKIES